MNSLNNSAAIGLLLAILASIGCGADTSPSAHDISSSSSSSSSSGAGMGDMSGGEAYQAADGIKGGQLYAKFWASETGFSLSDSELANQEQLDTIVTNEHFFSCAQCHGWDQLGRLGGYSNRAPSLTRPRIADVDLARTTQILTPQALFDSIKSGGSRRPVTEDISNYDPELNAEVGDAMPDYSEILTDAQIWDLVKFLKEEALDTTELYDIVLLGGQYPQSRGFLNLGANGSPVAGDALYGAKCSICHGADGTGMLVDGGIYTVGRYLRAKPFIGQHKVKFGHLGSIMGPVLEDRSPGDIQDLFAAMRDTARYPDVKPQPQPEPQPEPEPEPIDGLFAFLKHCSGCHSGAGEGPDSPRYGDVTGASEELIKFMIQSEPKMHHLRPDDPAQAAPPAEVAAIAEFLGS